MAVPNPSLEQSVENGLNTLRAILVGLAVIAAIILAVAGQWRATAVLSVGILAHGAMWVHLYRRKQDVETTSSSA